MTIAFKFIHCFRHSITIVLISLTLLTCFAAQGQKNYFVFNTINQQHGLENPWVIKVLQGPQGFIWVGSQNGLYRFDGYQVKAFSHDAEDPTSLPDNYVQALYVYTAHG